MSYTYELNQAAARDYAYSLHNTISDALRSINTEILFNRELEDAYDEDWAEEYNKLTDPVAELSIADASVLERAEQNDEELSSLILSTFNEFGTDTCIPDAYQIITRQGY